jgi:hypothetical protein
VIPQATVKEWELMCKAWDAAPYPKAGWSGARSL